MIREEMPILDLLDIEARSPRILPIVLTWHWSECSDIHTSVI